MKLKTSTNINIANKRSFRILHKLLGYGLTILTLSGCIEMNKNEFDWLPSESAPINSPMIVVSGKFSFANGKGANVPSGKIISHGWGESVSTHVIGPEFKPLPNKLNIVFYSFLEDKFYQGEFDLPYDRILSYFQEGFYSIGGGKQETYTYIVAGVTPGGNVAVWIEGRGKREQVFYGKATPTTVDWLRITESDIPREQYAMASIERRLDKESLAHYKKNGITAFPWDSYQKRYFWQPFFVVPPMTKSPKVMHSLTYVNGESDTIFYPILPETISTTRAIPMQFTMPWKRNKDQALTIRAKLNVEEVTVAFEQIASTYTVTAETPILLMSVFTEITNDVNLDLFVKYEDTEILLKKTTLEVFGALNPDNEDYYHQDIK